MIPEIELANLLECSGAFLGYSPTDGHALRSASIPPTAGSLLTWAGSVAPSPDGSHTSNPDRNVDPFAALDSFLAGVPAALSTCAEILRGAPKGDTAAAAALTYEGWRLVKEQIAALGREMSISPELRAAYLEALSPEGELRMHPKRWEACAWVDRLVRAVERLGFRSLVEACRPGPVDDSVDRPHMVVRIVCLALDLSASRLRSALFRQVPRR